MKSLEDEDEPAYDYDVDRHDDGYNSMKKKNEELMRQAMGLPPDDSTGSVTLSSLTSVTSVPP